MHTFGSFSSVHKLTGCLKQVLCVTVSLQSKDALCHLKTCAQDRV